MHLDQPEPMQRNWGADCFLVEKSDTSRLAIHECAISFLVTPGPPHSRSASPGFSFVLACLSGVVNVARQPALSPMHAVPCHSIYRNAQNIFTMRC